MIATYGVYADFVSQLYFLYKVNSDDGTDENAKYGTIMAIHGLALAVDGAVAVTDFLAKQKASTSEPEPEDNSTTVDNSTETEEPTGGYYWARLKFTLLSIISIQIPLNN